MDDRDYLFYKDNLYRFWKPKLFWNSWNKTGINFAFSLKIKFFLRKNFGVLIKVFAVSFSTGSYFSRLLFCTVFFICFLFFGRGYVQDGFFRFTRGEFFFRLKDWYLFLSLFFVRNYWFWFFINSHFVFILAFFCMCSLFGAFGRTIGFRRRFVKSLFYLCQCFFNKLKN